MVCLAASLACGDDDGGMDDAGREDADRMDTGGDDGGDIDAGDEDAGDEDAGPMDAGRDDAMVMGGCAMGDLPGLALEDVASGLSQPLLAVTAPGEPNRIYVIEKEGTIAVIEDGTVLAERFLDVTDDIASGGERGLLGLAFHPDYAENGRFFVYYTPPGRNQVVEFARESVDPPRAANGVVATLMDVPDPESNHNGGMITFGPGDYLYVATGDGGGSGDDHGEFGHGLDRNTLFGAILRLDVDAPGEDYAAAGNPFTPPEGLPQIYHYGLRNPWRVSFDRAEGDLYIADVGQNEFEEVSVIPSGTPGGRNLGWRAYEGLSVFDADNVDRVPEHFEPAIVYAHSDIDAPTGGGSSITGGYVYRGSAIPALNGWYLYADFNAPNIAAMAWCDGTVEQHVTALTVQSGIAGFGEDANGEILVTNLNGGWVRRIVAE